jgi:hypothetical protein
LKILGLNQSLDEGERVSVLAMGNDAFGELSVARTTGPPESVF